MVDLEEKENMIVELNIKAKEAKEMETEEIKNMSNKLSSEISELKVSLEAVETEKDSLLNELSLTKAELSVTKDELCNVASKLNESENLMVDLEEKENMIIELN